MAAAESIRKETGPGSKMDDAYENRCQSEGEMSLRRRIAELEHANGQLHERLVALERERDGLRAKLAQSPSEREQMFQATLDAITETLVVMDSNAVIQAINRTAADRLGHRREDLVGCDGRDSSCEVVPPDVRNARLACLDEVVRTGKPMRVSDRRAGMVFDQMYYPVVDETGRVTQVVVFAQDITARVEMEKELVESRQKYQDLVENVNDVIYTGDRDGNLLTVNEAVKRVFGFDPREIVGTHFSRWIPKEVLGRLEEARALALDGRRAVLELAIPGKDAGEHWVEVSLGPLVAAGKIVGTQGIIRDITDRRRAERTVRESEGMLHALFDAVTESVLMLDREGTILMLNETAARRFGRSVGELIGVRLADMGSDVIPSEVVDRRLERIREVMATRAPVQFEDDRVNRRFFTSMYPILDPDGAVRRIAVFAKDVSEERAAQREVKGLQQQIEFILGAAKMGLDIIDGDFNLRYVDPAWQRIYGPYEGRKCHEYFMDRDRVCSDCAIPRALASGQRIVSDEVLIKEGNRPIRVTTIPFQTDSGERLVAEVNVDISDRLELERGLMESEERYRTVVESAGEAIAIIDEQGVFLFMNGTAAQAMGGKASDFKGKTMWDLFPKAIADRQAGSIRRVIQSAEGVNLVVLSDVRGQPRWYNTTIQPLRDSTGRVTAGLMIARDIHELRTAQQELEAFREKMMRAEQLASLGTLSATYAHELNQPLTVIRLSLQNAIEDLDGVDCPPTVLEDLHDGLAEISNITGIIERFRGLARHTSDRPVTKVILAATAGRVIRLLDENARKRRLRLSVDQLEGLPPIYAGEKDIEQVFFALAQNAVQAADGSKDRCFTITGVCRDGQVELRFTDDCGGIHPDHVGHVFDPFFTTKREGEGTGLGLCIVHRVVSQVGGRVRVESRFGEGTTFVVTLPVEGS
ncbi:MAG: PAS domain-containing protein [Phycisphaerales bacterium]